MNDSVNKPTGELGCLLRMLWMAGIPIVVFVTVVSIVKQDPPFPSMLDGLYWVMICLLAAVRYADVQYLCGKTADGKPATTKDWRRFSLIIISISLIVWISARLLA